MGTSKAIGPGRRIAALLPPAAGHRRVVRGALGTLGPLGPLDISGFFGVLRGSPAPRRSGLTRSDGAGTGSRVRPESECDLPRVPRSHWRYTQRLYPETCNRDGPCGPRFLASRSCGTRGARQTADGPGKTPGRLGDFRIPDPGSEVDVAAAAWHGGGLLPPRPPRLHRPRGGDTAPHAHPPPAPPPG